MDDITIHLENPEKTASAGHSLAKTLYKTPVTITLSGELGAGKTTFLQGFAMALGIQEPVTSPTYALEQWYHTAKYGQFVHLDLYRLKPEQARELLRQTEDHTGIRCIEWPEKLEADIREYTEQVIRIHLNEEGTGREITCSFEDIQLPSRTQIEEWRTANRLPLHISAHCDAVTKLSLQLADELLKHGNILRLEALTRAAEVHDLFRFVDFREGASPKGFVSTEEDWTVWNTWKTKYANLRHEHACSLFLREQGYAELADIVEVHGLMLPSPEKVTIEQKILYYADKCVIGDRIATLDERFDDFTERYGHGTETEDQKIWYAEAKKIELELFPDGTSI
jgi:tRNA threonylcarbamoyladenosine biosynthesis protein TsaE